LQVEKIDGVMLVQMILSGAYHLKENAEKIDALNVFPVPDGDTGTNMSLSMTSGANEASNQNSEDVSVIADALKKGLLMGARGNSGVILSQIFRGFAKDMEDKQSLTAKDLAEALSRGAHTAYKAVMKPIEGTILTVAKDAAKQAIETAEKEKNVIALMEEVVEAAKASLKRTPELLSVLKEVGVVDSGGQGLVTIYEGFLAGLKGENHIESSLEVDMDELVNAEHHKSAQNSIDTSDIEFGYCTEFMVRFEAEKTNLNPFNEKDFQQELAEHGDSLLVVSDEEIVKVHIHAEYPGTCLTIGQRYGSLMNIKIDNMRHQHENLLKEQGTEAPKKEYAVIAVAAGEGIKKIFESLGVTFVIEGGQTMNPSTQTITETIQKAHAQNILILPNNKNIFMSAEQAGELVEGNVAVVRSKTIPEGMNAMLGFDPEADIETNKQQMLESGNQVKTGQVTFAVRDTQIDGITIEKGNYIGITDGKIAATHLSKQETVKLLLDEIIEPDAEILTILQGEEATEKESEELLAYVEERFENLEIELHNGQQPVYSYIFSIE